MSDSRCPACWAENFQIHAQDCPWLRAFIVGQECSALHCTSYADAHWREFLEPKAKIEAGGWYADANGFVWHSPPGIACDFDPVERLDLAGNPLTEKDVGRWVLWVGPDGPFDPIKIRGEILIGFLGKQSSRGFRRLTAREVKERKLEPEPSPGKEIDGINPFSPAQPSDYERLKEFFFAERKPVPKSAPPEKPKDVCPCCGPGDGLIQLSIRDDIPIDVVRAIESFLRNNQEISVVHVPSRAALVRCLWSPCPECGREKFK